MEVNLNLLIEINIQATYTIVVLRTTSAFSLITVEDDFSKGSFVTYDGENFASDRANDLSFKMTFSGCACKIPSIFKSH